MMEDKKKKFGWDNWVRDLNEQRDEKVSYDLDEIISQLEKSIEKCLEIGIKSDRIIIDPGIGFAKTHGHNLEIIAKLKEFRALNQPILIGTSRKSFIGKILNKEPLGRLHGTLATVSASILNGAHIVRVHDVKETAEAVKVTDAIINAPFFESKK